MVASNFELWRHQVLQIREQKIIWHFCTPKSASTFLSRCFMESTKGNARVGYFSPVPMHRNREQVVCAYSVAEALLEASDPQKVLICEHAHTRATEDLTSMISENHVVVIQTRPLLDTIISLVEFKDGAPRSPFGITDHLFWEKLTFDEKVDHTINVYVPWHIQYLQSWRYVTPAIAKAMWVSYDDAVNHTDEVVVTALAHQGIECRPVTEIREDKKNFNVGKSGRGRERLSDAQRAKVSAIVEPWLRYWGDSALTLDKVL
jgi:hypothetical protein